MIIASLFLFISLHLLNPLSVQGRIKTQCILSLFQDGGNYRYLAFVPAGLIPEDYGLGWH
jgi:hypothetical protein